MRGVIMKKSDSILYAVTGRRGPDFYDAIKSCLEGGATMLQLREKELKGDAFLEEVLRVKVICRKHSVSFIINDNVGMALGADGVHLGQDDLDVATAREILGPGKIIGASVHTVEEAVRAEREGADYLGAGAVFSTGSKEGAVPMSMDTLKAICGAVKIPVVAIGGITLDNAIELKGTGIAGIAVINAIFGAKDVKAAAAGLRCAAETIIK